MTKQTGAGSRSIELQIDVQATFARPRSGRRSRTPKSSSAEFPPDARVTPGEGGSMWLSVERPALEMESRITTGILGGAASAAWPARAGRSSTVEWQVEARGGRAMRPGSRSRAAHGCGRGPGTRRGRGWIRPGPPRTRSRPPRRSTPSSRDVRSVLSASGSIGQTAAAVRRRSCSSGRDRRWPSRRHRLSTSAIAACTRVSPPGSGSATSS